MPHSSLTVPVKHSPLALQQPAHEVVVQAVLFAEHDDNATVMPRVNQANRTIGAPYSIVSRRAWDLTGSPRTG